MHQINALKFLLPSLKSSVAEKKHVAMQKLFIKKERCEKMDKCLRYLKQWLLRCPPKEKRRKDE